MATWAKIVPIGEFPHPSGVVQVIDRDAVTAMAEAFDPARKLLVDFDHYSDLTNAQRDAIRSAGIQLPSEAAGWVTGVEARDDGLYGQIETTPQGAAALANATYRFLSPVWRKRDCEQLGDSRVRPKVLAKVGFTNEPNIQAIPEMVANRGSERFIGPLVDFVANREDEEKEADMEYRKKFCAAFDLPETATDEELDAAIAARKAGADAAAAEAEAMKNRAESAEAKLAEIEKAALAAKIEAALKEHEAVISNRADIAEALARDYDGTVKTLKALRLSAPSTLPNRADGETPPEGDNDFESKVRAQRKAVESYCNRNPGVSRSNAFEILRVQGHEAFK
jgi:phage I-like protein